MFPVLDVPEVLKMRRFQVQKIIWETPSVYTLRLVPVSGEHMFEFRAGQWVYLYPFQADSSSGGRAAFSVASSPDKSVEGFELGIKIKGELTQHISRLVPGDQVGIQGPFGVFVLPKELPQALTLFAAGIGITPLRSMIQALAHQNFPIPVQLFYSNSRLEEIAYFKELCVLNDLFDSFHCIFILTREAPKKWTGERGRIQAQMLDQYLINPLEHEFFMCGPSPFMETVRSLLVAQGVDVKNRLHQEFFKS